MSVRRFLNIRRADWQFSLRAQIEYVTICTLLLAGGLFVGMLPAICLSGMALALAGCQGELAVLLLSVASITANVRHEQFDAESSLPRQLLVLFAASLLCLWYRRRNHRAWRLSDEHVDLLHMSSRAENDGGVNPG